jgi:hypothetical protein
LISGDSINLIACNACFVVASFAMPNFSLFLIRVRLNSAIVGTAPIRDVITLARIERHLTVLLACPIGLLVIHPRFEEVFGYHDKSRTTSQMDC